MKRNSIELWAFALVFLGMIGFAQTVHAQTSMEDVKKETMDLLHTLKNYSADQKDAAVKDTKAALERMDQRIDALQTRIDQKWDQMSEAQREETRKSMDALRKQRILAEEWYSNLVSSSAKTWDNTKEGFSNAYKALSDAWEKSKQDFESE